MQGPRILPASCLPARAGHPSRNAKTDSRLMLVQSLSQLPIKELIVVQFKQNSQIIVTQIAKIGFPHHTTLAQTRLKDIQLPPERLLATQWRSGNDSK